MSLSKLPFQNAKTVPFLHTGIKKKIQEGGKKYTWLFAF